MGQCTHGKTKITAHEKKETNTEVNSKDQEDNYNELAQKEADPSTEDNIEDENETIYFTRKLNDDDNNEASIMNNNNNILVNDETLIAPLPVENPICEKHIDNMRLRVFHKDNIMSNATTLVMQLPESLSCDKKPSLGQTDGRLKDLQ